MKKINYFIFFFILFSLFQSYPKAVAFSLNINKNSINIEEIFIITITVDNAAGWEYCFNYDKNYFELVSATSDTGGDCVKTGSTLIGYKKVTFNIKAKKIGNSQITLKDCAIYDDYGNVLSSTYNSLNVIISTKNGLLYNSETKKWTYYKNGSPDYTYNGVAKNENGTFYLQNGIVTFKYNGKVTIDGKTYTVKNSKVIL